MLMRRVINMRTSIFASIIVASLGACAAQTPSNLQPGDDPLAGENGDGEAAKADAAHDTFGFVSIHKQANPQPNPLFGANYSLERTNRSTMMCNDGSYHANCGVHAINWGSMSQTKQDELEKMLDDELSGARTGTQIIVKGQIKIYVDFSAFEVSEVWAAQLDGGNDSGTFVQVFDNNIRCITAPCPTIEEDKLNSSKTANTEGLAWDDSGASESLQTKVSGVMGSTGAIVVGDRVTRSAVSFVNTLRSVNQVYLPVK
jgi:hypothetical protein